MNLPPHPASRLEQPREESSSAEKPDQLVHQSLHKLNDERHSVPFEVRDTHVIGNVEHGQQSTAVKGPWVKERVNQ